MYMRNQNNQKGRKQREQILFVFLFINLEKSNENILTLLTCVRKQPNQRLCVQALEEK